MQENNKKMNQIWSALFPAPLLADPLIFTAITYFIILVLYRDYPGYIPYHTPHIFSSDWLNELWDHYPPEQEPQARDDYHFVYMGPKGTWYVTMEQ